MSDFPKIFGRSLYLPPDLDERVEIAFSDLLRRISYTSEVDVKTEKLPLVRDPFNQGIRKRQPHPKKKDPVPVKVVKQKGESPIGAYVRTLEEETGDKYYTVGQAAEQLGVAASTVRHYARKRVTRAPSYYVQFGEMNISLFTDEDIAELRVYLENRNQVLSKTWEPKPWNGE